LQAGRGRLAVGWYQSANDAWQSIRPIVVLTPHELSEQIQSPTLVCGEMTEDERRLLSRKRKNVILASPAHSLRRPSFLAELAWQRWQAGQADDPATLSPIYLHYNQPIPE
jgi:tRNA threonylcarbamoyladenosine biosynthesis protein TsaB